MAEDLGTFKQLIAIDVIRVLVGVDHALRHPRPDLAEQLDHLPAMGQVRLRIDHHATTEVDQPGIRVADPVFLAHHGEATGADLFHSH